MKVRVTVKQGREVLAEINGREVPDDSVSIADMHKVIEVEAYLEKLTGLRWHISGK